MKYGFGVIPLLIVVMFWVLYTTSTNNSDTRENTQCKCHKSATDLISVLGSPLLLFHGPNSPP